MSGCIFSCEELQFNSSSLLCPKEKLGGGGGTGDRRETEVGERGLVLKIIALCYISKG